MARVQLFAFAVLLAGVIDAKHFDPSCSRYEASDRVPWDAYVFGGRHTYFTYVQMSKTTSQWQPDAGCSGTFLNDKTVLIAASCLDGATYAKITVAPTQWNFPIFCPRIPKVEADVKKTIVHPKYDKATKKNNLALLKLKAPAPGFGTKSFCNPTNAKICQVFQAASLPTAATPVPKANTEVLSCGWSTYPGGYGKMMLNMKVKVVDKATCKAPGAANLDEATQFCAFTPEKEFCPADQVGAPVVQLDADGKGTLVAVASASSGANCQRSDLIYTNVISYVDWIKANLN